jgi:hypothetical protein
VTRRQGPLLLVAGLALAACGSDDAGASTPASGGSGGSAVGGAAGTSSGGSSGSATGGAGGGVVPAGSRILAMEIDQPDGADHAAELDVAMAIGVHGVTPTLPWSVLEPSPNQIDTTWAQAINLVYRPRGVEVMLTIPTIDTVSVLAPSDLAPALTAGTLAFDDPSVIQRFQAVLAQLLADLDPSVKLPYLLVGNEVNIFLADKPDSTWLAYGKFIDAARTSIKSQRPETMVGVNIAFPGMPGLDAKITELVANQDACFFSYYENGNDFGGTKTQGVAADVGAMVASCDTRPVILKEFGYPTGVSQNSLAGQVAFVGDLFATWDAHAERIPFAVYSRMFDGKLSDCEAQAAAYGAAGNQEFIQFLCTLGLRSYDDQPKPAWSRLGDEAKVRGF